MFNLKDKIAIITGASQGIGKSTAKIFSNAGAHVVCLARNKEKIQHLVDQISKDGNSASYIPCDISDSNLFSKAVSVCNAIPQLHCALRANVLMPKKSP